MAQSVQGIQTNLMYENCISLNSIDIYKNSLVQMLAADRRALRIQHTAFYRQSVLKYA
jgi:hypothetical protein